MKRRHVYAIFAALLTATALVACSSGGGGGGGAGSGQPVIAVGAMTRGSVIVNGIEFSTSAATTITADDNPKGADDLLNGMKVKVKGTVSDDGLTGTATEVQVENEVRGVMTKTGADTLTVNGQAVLVDGSTVFGNVSPASFATLVNGDFVEVHGDRAADGMIHATRVEKVGANIGLGDEVRGTISNLNTSLQTFNIGPSLLVAYGAATILPAGATLADGIVVEVHLSGTNATIVKVEDLFDDEFEHADGVEFEVEGLISGFSGGDTFNVGGEPVLMNSSTRFEGGIKGDLANDVKVEAEGHSRSGNALVAEKITFKENIRIEAVPDAAGSANALGLTVKTTSKTRFEGGLTSEASITTTEEIRIRGFLNLDGTITATRVIGGQNPDSNGRSVLQGPAVEVNTSGQTMKIAGVTITMAAGAQSFNDDSSDSVDDNVPFTSVDAFFTAISSNRMIVKAKGIFSAGPPAALAASEIEIE